MKNDAERKVIRIVIADDNAKIRQTLKDILEENGYTVDTVGDGYELVAYIKKNDPQIVILDLMMPEKNGIEVLDCLKCLRPKTKVVIYTSFRKYEATSFVRLSDKFILKDSPPEKLLEAIQELSK
jgi:CheY-like chemotaxis protein